MDTKQARFKLVIALCLVAVGVSMRLVPHPANFAPVAAIAIFGGATLPRRMALWAPVLAVVFSDAVIGFYDYRVMLTVWGCYAVIALVSGRWLQELSVVRGALMTFAGSLCLFVVTNFAVWLWGAMYAHTISGLIQCFVAALPFFRNTLLGDLFYTAALFGLYGLATQLAMKRLVSVPVNHQL